MSTVLVVDNYDSFVFNLVQYLGQLGVTVEVRRNDAVDADDPVLREAVGVLLSPGPGRPEDAGNCVELVHAVAGDLPVLGVCLGHQVIAAAYGGVVEEAPELLHGKTSRIHHEGAGVLRGLPEPFTATRYHSLAVREAGLPGELEVTGRTEGGVIMALRHRDLPIEGVQFHPESVLSEGGHLLLANWLAACGEAGAADRVPELAARLERQRGSAATD